MWCSDFIEALTAFLALTHNSVLIKSISINVFGDRFLIYPQDGEHYYVYHRESQELYKVWSDSWRNEAHKPELIGKL